VVVLAAVSGLAVGSWWLLSRDNGSSKNGSSKDNKPVAASPSELRAVASSVGHVVYWAGSKPSVTYELTRTSQGNVYIRYLPAGVKLGDKRPDFLTIGTYPKPNAFAAVEKVAKRKDEIVRKLSAGGLAAASPKRPHSVYFAYPGSDVLVEVYDPSPAKALQAVVSGQVTPIR
jgi:hypothetical protein